MASYARSRKFFFLSAFVFAVISSINATQSMRRPERYMDAPSNVNTNEDPSVHVVHRRQATSGKVSIGYFANWDIYGANFQPTDIVPNILTHILYAFANVDPSTGEISLSDSYADTQKHFPTDSWNDVGNNLYGNLKQLYLLKLQQRNLKVLLSIGGWTYSQSGNFDFVTTASSRATFVANAVQMIQDYGLDGIDIDFEYPANTAQGQGLADLMTALRTAFTNLAASNGDSTPYQLTAAVAAGPANYAYLVVPQMDSALSYWNLMAYDYAGSWLNFTDNQANLYGGARTGFNTDAAVKFYLGAGATAHKVVMGMPLYGHAFEDTLGLGQAYNGIGPGTLQAGIYSYNVLPLAGAQVFENFTDVSSYSYDPVKMEFVSYDTPDIVTLKAQYINTKGLGGSMFWELSTDKVGSLSLVGTSAGVLGALDQTLNHINFPNSQFVNIQNNMGQGAAPAPSSSSTTPASSSTAKSTSTVAPSSTSAILTSSTIKSSSTAAPTSTAAGNGACASVSAWNSQVAYTGGMQVSYDGFLWTAQWWTQADTPGGAAGVWTKGAAC